MKMRILLEMNLFSLLSILIWIMNEEFNEYSNQLFNIIDPAI